MPRTCFRATVVALLFLAVACSRPTSPTRPTPPAGTISPTPTGPVPVPDFPAITAPARVYLAAHSLPRPSRFLLYEDGRFALQYTGNYESLGTYREAGGVITFSWETLGRTGPWGATGSLTGEDLTVHYNLDMQLSDFVDDVYTHVQ